MKFLSLLAITFVLYKQKKYSESRAQYEILKNSNANNDTAYSNCILAKILSKTSEDNGSHKLLEKLQINRIADLAIIKKIYTSSKYKNRSAFPAVVFEMN